MRRLELLVAALNAALSAVMLWIGHELLAWSEYVRGIGEVPLTIGTGVCIVWALWRLAMALNLLGW